MADVIRASARNLPFLLIAVLAIGTGCKPESQAKAAAERAMQSAIDPAAPVRTGAAVLFDDLSRLHGKRVGVIANQTARVVGTHLVDSLLARGVNVSAIFAPEHGFRGDADAGASIESIRDERTGIPIHSIYGSSRAPDSEVLDSLDVLIFDIQDVGARFYTYISSMGLSMQAAARAGVPFVVLDRPNPIGGEYVSGFVREPDASSFVGLYPIPIAHGLTVGELATMIVGEQMLDDLGNLDLSVVRMEGWNRSMLWVDTGLDWIAPSPNLPGFDMTLLYPGTCLIEATSVNEGRGTMTPFELIGAEWIDSDAMVRRLTELELPGVSFSEEAYTPVSIPGMSSSPKLMDKELNGVRIHITDAHKVEPVETGVALLVELHRQAAHEGRTDLVRESGMLRLAGTKRVVELLDADASADSIAASWKDEVASFRAERKRYLLY